MSANKDLINLSITKHCKKLFIHTNSKDIIEYVEQSNNKKRKKFNFWKLLGSNE